MSEQADCPLPPPSHSALLHRWFVQYNPFYLVSAALVLYGLTTLSTAVASSLVTDFGLSHGALAQLGISAIAELYAWALVGGAALLVRIRLRRPALMLALLAAVFQCDLTLHCATTPHLGTWGMVGSALWIVSSLARLRALVWAMQLQLSRSSWVLPIVGAAGLACSPFVVRGSSGTAASSIVAAWLFVMLAAGLWSRRVIRSKVALDPWPRLVARRARLAVWLGWMGMLVLHAAFWLGKHPGATQPALALPVVLLLLTRHAARERMVWLAVAAVLACTLQYFAPYLWLIAAMSAGTLLLRAYHKPVRLEPTVDRPIGDPYRVEAALPITPRRGVLAFVVAPASERVRLLSGALGCATISMWLLGWPGGEAPAHLWWLDVGVAIVAGIMAHRARNLLPATVPVTLAVHLIVTLRLVPLPTTDIGWALTTITAGFALLAASLLASVRFRRVFVVDPVAPDPRPEAHSAGVTNAAARGA